MLEKKQLLAIAELFDSVMAQEPHGKIEKESWVGEVSKT